MREDIQSSLNGLSKGPLRYFYTVCCLLPSAVLRMFRGIQGQARDVTTPIDESRDFHVNSPDE